MGTYINLGPVKLRHTRRGWRLGIGPRWFRRWYGAGGRGTSTGIGPFSKYVPDKRGSSRHRPGN